MEQQGFARHQRENVRNKRCKRLKEDQKTSELAKFKQEGLSKTFQAYQGKLGVVLDPNFRLIKRQCFC